MHSRRVHCVGPVDTARHLAEKLTQSSWCLCSGFSVAGHPDYVFLNDSTSEDSAAEFGIIKKKGEGFTQVESITFSWTTPAQALDYIERALRGEFDCQGYPVKVFVESPEDHSCRLCQ